MVDSKSQEIFMELQQALRSYIINGLELQLPMNEKLVKHWDILVFDYDKIPHPNNNEISDSNDKKRYLNLQIQFQNSREWTNKIKSSLMKAKTIIDNIKSLPSSSAGAQLLREFIIDLLGRDTPDAIIFEKKSADYFGSSNVVTLTFKTIMFTLIIN